MSIQRHDVHVRLISEQATPNFIPVLDSRFRPREVILLVSPQMRKQAGWLSEVLRRRVERVSEIVVDDAWDVAGIQDTLLELIAARQSSGLALNVTGGTKPMAIAAQEVFRAEGLPIFYLHPANNQIVPIFSGAPPFSIEERVGLSDYLAIHGFREVQRARADGPESYSLLGEEFVKVQVVGWAKISRQSGCPRALMKKGLRHVIGALTQCLPMLSARPDEEGICSI